MNHTNHPNSGPKKNGNETIEDCSDSFRLRYKCWIRGWFPLIGKIRNHTIHVNMYCILPATSSQGAN